MELVQKRIYYRCLQQTNLMRIEENHNLRKIVEALINQLVATGKIDNATAQNIINEGKS